MKPKHKALEKAKYTANGVRILSAAEQKEKMKGWPKSTKPMTHEEKREFLGDNSSSRRH